MPPNAAPPPPNLHSNHPDRSSRQWYVDEIVVAAFAFLGFGGAVFLPLRFGFAVVPPIVVSFLLATGLAALTYRYLGGIQGASLKVGSLKLGGALAALVGIALLVNSRLVSQVQPPPAAQVWELHAKVTDESRSAIEQLEPGDFKLSPPNTRVDPGGNFQLNFYTEPTLAGVGINYPNLTIGHAGFGSITVSLDPDQLKAFQPNGFKMEGDLRRIYVDHISLAKAPRPASYDGDAPPLKPASPSQLSAYSAAR
jgi:hypothetical protein